MGWKVILWFGTFLPDGFDTFAEVVEDMTAWDATAGREETTDDAGDVAADVECLRIIYPDAFHPKAEAADTWEYDCLTL